MNREIEKADAEVNSPSKVHNLNDSFLLMLANCIITCTESYEKYDPIKSLEIYNTAIQLNPNKNDAIEHKSPIELVENIKLNNAEINDLMDEIETILIGKDINE